MNQIKCSCSVDPVYRWKFDDVFWVEFGNILVCMGTVGFFVQCSKYVSIMHFYPDIKEVDLFCNFIVEADGQMEVIEVLVKFVKSYFSTGPNNSLSSGNLK